MLVRSKNGLQVPRHDNSTRYIGSEPVEVEDNAYYYRRLADGEIEVVKPVVAMMAMIPDDPTPVNPKRSK